jgi:mRNA interferase MazF
MALVNRGDVVDADLPVGGRRPVVVVSRQTAIAVRSSVTVVLVTSTVRGHRAEVPLGPDEGLDRECVANCDEIQTIRKESLSHRRGFLGLDRVRELDAALRLSLGLDNG